ncbi:hydroxymethylbilane synthase [Ferrovibrio terrae]|uniref:Porphobilinogen deaminase n=1 Tax=Ferrovibrio terrae TaxID=2594003 RepID=A0A516GZ88_9PROT|nr:hydroxymethylbilane synthase [Ferrovibrio terrae]QDO96838.1 hydroxymethylbilane synthase [Ferrovibrio terrae]
MTPSQQVKPEKPVLGIGTRGSPLALAQAHETRDRLLRAHPGLREDQIAIRVIKTTGDQIQDRALAEAGGKGLFTKEIEDALLSGEIDLAVHSMKDMPTALPAGLMMGAYLPREDVRDVLLAIEPMNLAEIPQAATVGTASLRRKAFLLARRPDLKVVTFRGNVQTRLRKLAAGDVAATFLAMAGLNRLKIAPPGMRVLQTDEMLPAVAQGAIGIECRQGDARVMAYLKPLDDAATRMRVEAERALLAVLDGSCRTPIAALAELDGVGMRLRGAIARPDGSELIEIERRGNARDGVSMGQDAGAELKSRIGPDFFKE